MLAKGVDAIIANDDPLAALLIQRLVSRNLKVPDDLAVVGFENDIIAPHTTPALTTIQIPVRKVVVHAVEMIVKSVEQPDCKAMQSRVFQPQLMVRKSG
jgi:DNA-binding LacI/PurR family transcriptional regulator